MKTRLLQWSGHEVRSLAGRYPRLYLPYMRWRYRDGDAAASAIGPRSGDPYARSPVRPGTDVVIEGFPRSANTFAVVAFVLAQPSAPSVAHHLHVPAQVLEGARMGIPTMVLVRDPDEAVLSHVIRRPHISLRQGYRDYVRFHQGVLPMMGRVVVVSFEQVTSDFGAAVRRLNQVFDSSFAEFDHTEENVRRCFELIEDRNRRRFGGEPLERGVARPSAVREEAKARLRGQVLSTHVEKLRSEARKLYERFLPETRW